MSYFEIKQTIQSSSGPSGTPSAPVPPAAQQDGRTAARMARVVKMTSLVDSPCAMNNTSKLTLTLETTAKNYEEQIQNCFDGNILYTLC